MTAVLAINPVMVVFNAWLAIDDLNVRISNQTGINVSQHQAARALHYGQHLANSIWRQMFWYAFRRLETQ